MKYSNLLGLAALPAMRAMPKLPAAGVEIRDEATLETLKVEHAHTLEALRNCTAEARSLSEGEDLDKRNIPALALAGMALVESGVGGELLGKVASALKDAFSEGDEIWSSSDQCRGWFKTKGGGNCEVRSYDKGGDGGRTAQHDPSNTYTPKSDRRDELC